MKDRPGSQAESVCEVLTRLLARLFVRSSEGELQAVLDRVNSSDVTSPAGEPAEMGWVEGTLRAADAWNARLDASRPEEEAAVDQLLAAPSPERWSMAAVNPVLHRPRVIDRLLHLARVPRPSSEDRDVEELGLLALHLCERLEPEQYPEGLVADLLCRALGVRVEHLIHRRQLRAAELAALRTRDLLLESSDPLVAYEVGLASAFLHWAKGEREAALALLDDLRRLAGGLGEVGHAGELSLWCCRLLLEVGDFDAAARCKLRAEKLLGRAEVESCWEAIRARHEALHLAEAPHFPRAISRTVH